MKSILITLATISFLMIEPTFAASHYVGVDGLRTNAGTSEAPWDVESALSGQHEIAPGDTIYLADGTYRHPDRTWNSPGFAIALEGTKEAPIYIRPLAGARVTFDGKVEVKPNGRFIHMMDLEITVSETASWDRRVTAGGLAIDGKAELPQGGLNILGGTGSKFINLIIHDMNSGVGFWRTALDAEMHGCLIYGIGAIGPDRWHGPGIYTQNESGVKRLTDNILVGNYSTTIQAYGSSKASVNGFQILGNIAFAPLEGSQRERILVGGGQPSRDITVSDNVLYGIPLQLGYNAPHNEDATVHDNWIIDGGLSIQKFKAVDQKGNHEISANDPRPARAADVIIRPNAYTPGRAHIAILNWKRSPKVTVDLGAVKKIGDQYRIVSALDYYGTPVAEGTWDGRPIELAIPVEPRTGRGEFCAFIVTSTH